MPTLNKLPKKKTERNPDSHPTRAYNAYRDLRRAYLMNHPLCEMCLAEGKTASTEEIHHIRPILTGRTEIEQLEIAINPDNLIALCAEHHLQMHNKRSNH